MPNTVGLACTLPTAELHLDVVSEKQVQDAFVSAKLHGPHAHTLAHAHTDVCSSDLEIKDENPDDYEIWLVNKRVARCVPF